MILLNAMEKVRQEKIQKEAEKEAREELAAEKLGSRAQLGDDH